MKRNLILVHLRGAVALQAARRGTANCPKHAQQYRPNRQTLGSSEPAHHNYPRPRALDKEVATRLPDAVSSNQQLGDGKSGETCRFCWLRDVLNTFLLQTQVKCRLLKRKGGQQAALRISFCLIPRLWFLPRFFLFRRRHSSLLPLTFTAADQAQ